MALAHSHTSEHYELCGKSPTIQRALSASALLTEEPDIAYGHQAQTARREMSSEGTEVGIREGITQKLSLQG